MFKINITKSIQLKELNKQEINEELQTLMGIENLLKGLYEERNLLKRIQQELKHKGGVLITTEHFDSVNRFIESNVNDIEVEIEVNSFERNEILGFSITDELDNDNRKKLKEIEVFGR